MTITVLTFGIAREILGGAIIPITFESELHVYELKATLAQQFPRLKELTSFAIAVNGAYANADTIINPGDEIAIIPPVSGG